MAIQLDYTAERIGATFPASYCRIEGAHIQYNGGEHKINIQVEVYTDQAASTGRTRAVESLMYSASMVDVDAQAADDFVGRCYEWLSTQNDFLNGYSIKP